MKKQNQLRANVLIPAIDDLEKQIGILERSDAFYGNYKTEVSTSGSSIEQFSVLGSVCIYYMPFEIFKTHALKEMGNKLIEYYIELESL